MVTSSPSIRVLAAFIVQFNYYPFIIKHNNFQERFITSYLTELAAAIDDRPSTTDIEELKEEIRCFTLVSHFLWSLWSIVNVHQEIEFGYWVRYNSNSMYRYFS